MNELERAEARLNPMQAPRIEKVVVNMSIGQSGEQLQKAMTVLEQLTGQKPCQRVAKKTIKEWGIRKMEPMACMVTLRKQAAEGFLRRAFEAVGNKLSASSFDDHGNFAFGIGKHIDIPGTKYDPRLGIFGMNVCVSIKKPGHRAGKKSRMKPIGKRQRIKMDEAITHIRSRFGLSI